MRDSPKSSPAPQFENIISLVLSLLYSPTLTSYMTTGKHSLAIGTLVAKVQSLLFNMLCRFVIAFLSRSMHILISRLQSPCELISELKEIKSVSDSTVPPPICHEMMGLDPMIFVFLTVKF